MERQVNGFTVETVGGFVTIKYWVVYNANKEYMGTFFKFGDAKTACLNNDFSEAFKEKLY